MPYLNYLKIKCVSLAAESKLIRKDEVKRRQYANQAQKVNKEKSFEYNDSISKGLHFHRVTIVRNEARSAHIAYGFLREYKYEEIEGNSCRDVNWNRVNELVYKYGEDDKDLRMTRFCSWKNEAIIYKREVITNKEEAKETRRLMKIERKTKNVATSSNSDYRVSDRASN